MYYKLQQGKALGSQVRQVVNNVYSYFAKRKEDRLKQGDEDARCTNVTRETSSATGVSEWAVKMVKKKSSEEGGCESPARKRPNRADIEWFDDFEKCALRRLVHTMYLNGEIVTLDTVTSAVQEKMDKIISRSTLRRQLLQIGFKFRQVNNRKLLAEKPHVVAARNAFLRRILKIRQQTPGRDIVYLDETWYNQYDMKTVAWLDDSEISGQKTVIGKGKRLILAHAGSENGFIPQACLCFRTDGKSADYHTSMNAECFEPWFLEQLLPNIPSHSVIVMDNASYHSRCAKKTPASNWRKADIQEWLKDQHVEYDPDMRKVELLELVRPLRQKREYVLDNLAQDAGHEVIRLPPYHCDLNPIEMIWAHMKAYVRQRNTSGRLEDVERLLRKSQDVIDEDLWRNCCRHVMKLEQQYWRDDGMMEDIEPVVVSLQQDSSTDSDSDIE